MDCPVCREEVVETWQLFHLRRGDGCPAHEQGNSSSSSSPPRWNVLFIIPHGAVKVVLPLCLLKAKYEESLSRATLQTCSFIVAESTRQNKISYKTDSKMSDFLLSSVAGTSISHRLQDRVRKGKMLLQSPSEHSLCHAQ